MARTLAGTRTIAGNRFVARDFGTSLFFNGSSALVQYTSNAGVNLSIFTYTAWVKPTNTANTGSFIKGDATLDGGVSFQLKSNGLVEFDKQNQVAIGTSTIPLINGQWNFWACTYDASGNWTMYVNGQAAGSGNNLQSFVFGGNYWVGKANSGSNYITGFIGNFRLYNVVLSKAQLDNIYYGNPDILTNLALRYKFDEGSGTTANDASGNGNTGTITAATYSTDVFMKPRTVAP